MELQITCLPMSIIIIYVFGCLYGLSVNVVLAGSEIGISYLQEKAKQTVKKAEKKLEDMMTNDWWQPFMGFEDRH